MATTNESKPGPVEATGKDVPPETDQPGSVTRAGAPSGAGREGGQTPTEARVKRLCRPCPVSRVQAYVGFIWITLSTAVIFPILAIQAHFGKHEGLEHVVRNWLSTIFPALSLVVVAFGVHHFAPPKRPAMISCSYSWAVGIASTAYLFVALFTLLAEPFSPVPQKEVLEVSQSFMALFQGIVIGLLTRIFIVTRPGD